MPAKILRFFGLSRSEQLLFLKAYFLVLFYSTYVVFVPKRLIFKRLGEKGIESEYQPDKSSLTEIQKVEKAVRRAIRCLPWRSKCFSRAIAAKRILKQKRIPSTIYLGVAKEDDKVIAHAWLRAGNIIVTGREEMKKFNPVLFYT